MKIDRKTNSQIRKDKETLVMENFASVMKKLDATFLIEEPEGSEEIIVELIRETPEMDINKNNWSGESAKINVNDELKQVTVPDIGTFTLEFVPMKDMEGYTSIRTTLDGEETDISGYGDGQGYSFSAYDISREHKNPYVALAQLASNIY